VYFVILVVFFSRFYKNIVLWIFAKIHSKILIGKTGDVMNMIL